MYAGGFGSGRSDGILGSSFPAEPVIVSRRDVLPHTQFIELDPFRLFFNFLSVWRVDADTWLTIHLTQQPSSRMHVYFQQTKKSHNSKTKNPN